MKISAKLRKYSKTLTGYDREILWKFADCFEIIPKTLCENSGLDQLEIISRLRNSHQNDHDWSGIDLETGSISNSFSRFIIEPSSLKMNIIQGSLEAACSIMNIDTILN
jgi:T-complex protein 1 subunit eta